MLTKRKQPEKDKGREQENTSLTANPGSPSADFCLFEQLPWQITKKIGTYLPTKDLGRFALASQGMKDLFEELTPVRRTLELNNYVGLKKAAHAKAKKAKKNEAWKDKFAENAFNEGNAARLLFVSDPELKNWDDLSEEAKQGYRENFNKSKFSEKGRGAKETGGPKEAGGTPDFIFRNRITDVFTVSVSYMEPDQSKAALRAVNTSLVPKTIEKWNSYGVGTIAVADISSFPSDLSTQAVINTILELRFTNQKFKLKVDAREKENLGLCLIRNLELTEVLLK